MFYLLKFDQMILKANYPYSRDVDKANRSMQLCSLIKGYTNILDIYL